MLWRRGAMHGGQHAFVLLRAGDGEHGRVTLRDAFGLGAHAAGDDHLAIGGQSLADRGQRLFLGAVEKAAGIHHHEVGAFVLARQLVTLGPQAGDDAFRVNQRLRAAERHEADLRRRRGIGRGRWTDDGFR